MDNDTLNLAQGTSSERIGPQTLVYSIFNLHVLEIESKPYCRFLTSHGECHANFPSANSKVHDGLLPW